MMGAATAAAPMFTFTEEHRALREVLRDYFADDPSWAGLLSDVGADAILFDRADATPIDVAILAEEAGAALFGGPIVPALLASGCADALGVTERLAPVRDGALGVAANVVGAEPVWNAEGGCLILLTGPGSVALLDSAGDGVRITALNGLDPTRPLGRVRAGGASAIAALRGPAADSQLAGICPLVELAIAAELLGVAQRVLDGTVEYVRQRVQFGRTIGSFQAVKHRMADLYGAVELARSAVYGAAWGLTAAPADEQTAIDLAIAGALSRDTALTATRAAIQLHGGIAITWEHWAHRYLRRANAVVSLTGSAGGYRSRLADLVDRRDAHHG